MGHLAARPEINCCYYYNYCGHDPLCLQQGDIELEVVFVAPDDDSDDENQVFEDENGFRFVSHLSVGSPAKQIVFIMQG